MPPATASRAGVTPEASRDTSSGTLGQDMKTTFIAFIAIIASQIFPSHSELGSFESKLSAALSAKDIEALQLCFYWGDTPEQIRQIILQDFRDVLRENDYLDMYFFTLDSKNINPGFIKNYCSGRFVNNVYYKSNLPLKCICTISFRNPSKKNDSGTVRFVGIAIDPDGKDCMPGSMPIPEQ